MKPGLLAPAPGARRSGPVRWSEAVVLLFLVYTAVLAWSVPVAGSVRVRLTVLNPALVLGWAAMIWFDFTRGIRALSIARDWLPLAAVLLAYREMGWFAAPHHVPGLELPWVSWDRVVLYGGAKTAIESLGPLVPSLLEIAYALVYTLAPFSVAVLYLYHRRRRADRFLFVFCLGVLLCYGQFPFWPSEPPRTIFAGQDLPAYNTVFRSFNLWMLAGAGIHTSVFPSAHVAGAFSTAFGMRLALPGRRWVSRLLLGLAVVIAAATFYGRYHYLADAVAGFGMALAALGAGLLRQKLSRRPSAIQWHARNSPNARTDRRGADARRT